MLQYYVQMARSQHSHATNYTTLATSQHRLGREADRTSNLLRRPFRRSLRSGSSSSTSSGASSLHVAHDELRCIRAITSVCQMWCQNDGLTRANQIAGMAHNLRVASSDFANRLAVVWVAEDNGAADKGRVLRREHVCSVVYELATLTVMEISTVVP
jgi:hypothetical protein